jgi:hypothetical protein
MARFSCLVLVVGLLAGCTTPSIGPGYTSDVVVHDDAYLGVWVASDGEGRYSVAKGEGPAYAVTYERLKEGEEYEPASLEVVVFELDGVRYLDVYPGQDEVERSVKRIGTLFWPVHNFCRVELDDGSLRIEMLDAEWINGQGELLGAASTRSQDTTLLTADAASIQRLLRRAQQAPEAFSDALVLRRENVGR